LDDWQSQDIETLQAICNLLPSVDSELDTANIVIIIDRKNQDVESAFITIAEPNRKA